jgi:hypothetical protein
MLLEKFLSHAVPVGMALVVLLGPHHAKADDSGPIRTKPTPYSEGIRELQLWALLSRSTVHRRSEGRRVGARLQVGTGARPRPR